MNDTYQKGSALLLVVVVLLVLSGLGMAMLALTDSNRESVAWNDHVKDALYAAEIGLRVGEGVLTAAGSTSADAVLQHIAQAQTPVIDPAVPTFPQMPGDYTNTNLGTYLTAGGVELANQAVQIPGSPSGRPLPDAFYSLYVRNDPADISVADNDLSTNANEDNDFRVNLIAVAWVSRGGRVLAVKILEEEFAWNGVNQAPSGQKAKDAGGTGSAQFGG